MGDMISYQSNGGTSQGYLAVPGPPARQDVPAVIVIQEWWGLVGHITSVADRLAAAGFLALAPDLYHGHAAGEPDEAQKLMMGLAMDQAAKDIAGAAAYLAGRAEGSGAVGAVGFCMGGSLALWAATISDHITAAVGYYPPIPWERMQPSWQNYSGKAALVHADEEEGGSGAPGIQQAIQMISDAGGEVSAYDYAGTGHAFFNDDRPEVYNEAAAALSWDRTLTFLHARLSAA
ncbi:MAG TPA: dienelactone hydrolase family protein [Streptosporangiaceae bacterium]|jgi:carboxymethylenebutenolidase